MEKTKSRTYKSWAIPLFLAVLAAFILSGIFGDYLTTMFVGLLSSLTPILIGLLVVFLLKHLIDFFERTVLKNAFSKSKISLGLKRTVSVTISFIIFFLALFLILNTLIPRVVEILTELISNRVIYVDKVKTELSDFLNNIIPIDAYINFDDAFNNFVIYLEQTFYELLPRLLDISTNTLLFIGKILLGFFIAFLYLIDKEKIRKFSARMTKAYLPENTADTMFRIVKKSDKILLDYFVGKFLEAVVITIVMGITLLVLKVPYAFELAFIMSVLNFIPYIGFILALIPITIISIIFGSINLAITVIITCIIVFTILTTFVTPFIIGSKVKTNVLLMLVVMLIGGGMFGIIGMAVAPPFAAILSVIITENVAMREKIKQQEIEQEKKEHEEEQERRNKENDNRLKSILKTYGDNNQLYDIFDMLKITNESKRLTIAKNAMIKQKDINENTDKPN